VRQFVDAPTVRAHDYIKQIGEKFALIEFGQFLKSLHFHDTFSARSGTILRSPTSTNVRHSSLWPSALW
jgi:hypothetical protein